MSQTRRTILVLLVGVFTATVSFAQAEAAATAEEVLLRLRPTESGTYPMRVSQSQNTIVDMGPLGQQEIVGETVFEGRFKVTPLSGGGLEMETVYDRFTMTLDHMGQQTVIDSNTTGDAPYAQALTQITGKPLTVQFDDTGRVLEVSGFSELMKLAPSDGVEDPQALALLEMIEQAFSDDSMAAMAQQAQTIYPQDAVGVGDTWKAGFDISNAAIGEMSIDTEYKLVEIAQYKGRDAAKLDLVMDIVLDGDMPMIEQMNAMFAQQGGSIDIGLGEFDATGSLWIDVESGLTLDTTIDQTMAIAMNLTMPDQELAMNMSVASVTRMQFFDIDAPEPAMAVE